MNAQRYDAFVSYAHENAEWVRALATNLHRHGLAVFFDEWDDALPEGKTHDHSSVRRLRLPLRALHRLLPRRPRR